MISRSHARMMRKRMEQGAESLSDTDALDAIELYPIWKPGMEYVIDIRLRYEDKLYKVVQAHTSQSDWTPDITPALYTEVAKPGEIPVWKQPTGVQDAYMTGDKVHFPGENDPVYISTIDNNVWEPGVFGWDILS